MRGSRALFGLLAALCLVGAPLSGGCRSGFEEPSGILGPNMFCDDLTSDRHFVRGSRCYTRHDNPLLVTDSTEACERQGGGLALFETPEEGNEVVAGLELSANMRFGLSFVETAGWRWVNNAEPLYVAWADTEPAAPATGHYAAIQPDGLWVNGRTSLHPFICEYSANIIEWEGHTYVRRTPTATWDVARADCATDGGHLMTVNSAEEWLEVRSFANGRWIGGERAVLDGPFEWLTGEPFDFKAFDAGEPNRGTSGRACLRAATDGWHDEDCTTLRGYVCEFE